MHIKLLINIKFAIWAQRYSFFLNYARISKKKCIYYINICIYKIFVVILRVISKNINDKIHLLCLK